MKSFQDILVEKQEGTIILTFNRPAKMNALSMNLSIEVLEALESVKTDSTARVLVVTGAGEKAFSAGADLKERRTMTLDQIKQHNRKIFGIAFELENLSIPVIAAINGYALAGGLEITLGCDLRIASDSAQLGLPEVTLGILPAGGGTQRLPRLIGKAKAKELIFTGRRIHAAEAERIGLVNRVVPHDLLMKEVMELAQTIKANAPLAVSGAKQAINTGYEADSQTGFILERQIQYGLYASKDWQEGLAAFNEGRKPSYRGI
jgi:enoyl-CoA hydratase/carnithine racemase